MSSTAAVRLHSSLAIVTIDGLQRRLPVCTAVPDSAWAWRMIKLTRDGTAQPVLRHQKPAGLTNKYCTPVDTQCAVCKGHDQIQPYYSVENEEAHAGQTDRTRLGRLNYQARTGTGKKSFSLLTRPTSRGLATLPG